LRRIQSREGSRLRVVADIIGHNPAW
jgi:hypothetical protein